MRHFISSAITLAVAVSACTPLPPSKPVDATAVLPVSRSSSSPWTYPEIDSGPKAWPGVCAADPAASAPSSPAPTVQQSPIDFSQLSPPQPQSQTVKVNRPGHLVAAEQNVVFASSITVNGKTYVPQGFHFHWPNEHVLGNEGSQAFEVHIKAQNAENGSTAVFAIIFNSATGTKDDPSISAAQQSLASHAPVDMLPLLDQFRTQWFYAYVGSLTTPPCSTGIQWFVLMNPIAIPAAQFTAFTSALSKAKVPSNNRRWPRQFANPAPAVQFITPVDGN